jgi:hypothetical protein
MGRKKKLNEKKKEITKMLAVSEKRRKERKRSSKLEKTIQLLQKIT